MRVRCPECDAGLRVSAEDDGRKIECPKCDHVFRLRLDDEADDRPRRRPGRRDREADEEPATNNKLFAVIGGSVAAACAVGAVVWVVASRPKAEPAKPPTGDAPLVAAAPARANPPPPVFNTPPQQPVDPRRPAAADPASGPNPGGAAAAAPEADTPATVTRTPPPPAVPPEVAELGDLMTRTVSSPLPTHRLGKLDKADGERLNLEVPTFFSLSQARRKKDPPVPKAAKMNIDEIKAATTYIKVQGAEGGGNTGSGFYVGAVAGRGLVATNHHVIRAALARPAPGAARPTITVVFNSNVLGKEVSVPARVVAVDPLADLAVLAVPGDRLPAKPIDVTAAVRPVEGMDVQICGFPLGEVLATTEGRNPNITISPGSVSGLPTDETGRLDRVQITGTLVPGNSGGPIVDRKDGRLVGVAVSTVPMAGMQIGHAVPVGELIALGEGKLLATLLIPTGLDTGSARFKVVVPVMDPFGRVARVYLRYWAGDGDRPKVERDPLIGHKPFKGGRDVTMPVSDSPSALQLAIGDLVLPANADEVVLQLATETTTGQQAASPPVTFKFSTDSFPTPSDARPFADLAGPLAAGPDALAGQTVVVRGKVLRPPSSRGPVQDLELCDVDGRRPSGVRFVCDKDTAVQFDEVDMDHVGYDVRLTCVVGPRGADGRTVVRVARADFLDDYDTPVKSIPGEAGKDKLAALNRDPAKFAGQTLDLVARAAPVLDVKGLNVLPNSFAVAFASGRQPRNLQFVTTPGLAARLAEKKYKPNRLYKVRIAVKVEAPAAPGGVSQVTVRRVEILDPKDEAKPPLDTIE